MEKKNQERGEVYRLIEKEKIDSPEEQYLLEFTDLCLDTRLKCVKTHFAVDLVSAASAHRRQLSPFYTHDAFKTCHI